MKSNLDIQTIIINVDTPTSTALAILSALKYTNWPILLVDCTPDKTQSFFKKMQSKYSFEYTTMPLNIHGKTLDEIFMKTNHEYLMLLDSDAELKCDSFMDLKYLSKDDCFGCGFYHGPLPMQPGTWPGAKYMYYQERMFIPCTMLKVSAVRKALEEGISFAAKSEYNDFHIKFLAHLCYFRFYFKFWQNHEFIFSLPFRRKINFRKPAMIFYDTGADIYCYLKYKLNLYFVGYPGAYHSEFFNHYHGVTRNLLNAKDKSNSTALTAVEKEILDNLIINYNFDIKEYL